MIKKSFVCVGLLSVFLWSGCSARRSLHLSQKPIFMSSTGAVSEADLGLPIYPGAVVQSNQSYAGPKNQSAHSMRTISITLTAAAGVDEVEKFYREKLGRHARINSYSLGSGKLIDILLNDKTRQTHLEITPEAGGPGSIIVMIVQST